MCNDCAYDGAVCNSCDVQDMLDALEDLPVVDAKPVVHGEWKGFTRSRFYGIDKYSDPIYRDGIIWHCSKCSRRSVIKTNYCPNCGADMRKKS